MLLMVFNVVNRTNAFVYGAHSVLSHLIEPTLSPIRRILPKNIMIDFSPIILIFLLQFVTSIISMTILKYFNG
jgi:uncharacterized protein YggT (Ycf19 family)